MIFLGEKKMSDMEFGSYLKRLREERGLGINQLSTYSGVSSSQISRIESGLRGVPKPENIEKLSRALKVPYGEMMEKAGYIKTPKPPLGVNDYFAQQIQEYNENQTLLPLLGTIKAGEPLLMDRQFNEYVAVENSVLKGREAFVLRVQGNSMTGDRIYDGDKVVVVVQSYAEPNDIAVVAINGNEATLKRVKCQDGMCMLIPSNPDMQPMIYPAEEVNILGKVVEARRSFE
jgi:repressor LexA